MPRLWAVDAHVLRDGRQRNVLESSQLIQVVDTVAPYFTAVPEAVTVECDEALPSVLAEAEDACGTTTVSVSESVVDGLNANNYTVIRTFTATNHVAMKRTRPKS